MQRSLRRAKKSRLQELKLKQNTCEKVWCANFIISPLAVISTLIPLRLYVPYLGKSHQEPCAVSLCSIYFQNDVDRMSICPLAIHALLHIAPGIKFCGPVWCYWAFPMDLYCGSPQPGIRSLRFPWVSIDRYLIETAQLTQIKTIYNIAQ
jgi:hypothetical protein